ncbi:MAG: hypothetical protein WAU78_15520 [Roseiarcus sp.]
MSPISIFRRFWRVSAKILFASIVIAAIAANIHPIIAATLTYVSAFISGTMDPLWPHVGLLSVSVAASVAVGAGIIFEGQKYSPYVHRVAFWLVVVGIVFEAVCTIFLFVFDEGISSAQQSRIEKQQSEILIATDRATDAGFDAAVATNSAAEANERAAKLEKDAANANAETAKATESAAKANERAAELQLALEREIAARQPRHITAEQRTAILDFLRDKEPKGEVFVAWKLFDEEAGQFGRQILAVLKDSGYDAKEPPNGQGAVSFGLPGQWIMFKDPDFATKPSYAGSIQAAFKQVLNILFDGTAWKSDFPDVSVLIIVGAKP